MSASREAALRALQVCHTQGGWADVALRRELAGAGLDSRDAALASRLVYGVEQNRLYLDHVLAPFCARGLGSLDSRTLDILRLGACQLLLLDRIPPMAAVNESVELAKRRGGRTAGFVNAVLRNLDRSRDRLPPLPQDPLERLSVKYSHPLWLVKEFAFTLGAEELEELLRADNAPAPVTAQVNTRRTTAEELARRLAACGVWAEPHPWMDQCLVLEGIGDLEALPPFREGLFYIQDPAARQAVLAARPRPGERVLDLCAAPGGKTFAAALAMEDRGRVIGRDLYHRKVEALATSAARLGLTCVETAQADATEPLEGEFDLVIADVPCSGLGVIRKKPDIRYKDPAGFADLLPLQAAILRNAAGAVAPGGRLLYATCTLRREENQGQVERFLARRGGDFALAEQETLWPHRHGTDGFFYAVLERK